ncbi:hypothetical protein GE061_014736 [Apolygus lucorum]|uniref:Uncharacterized protein n=1 Tax=Apolygus lucorum TaxID=248454 RepID=A0A8S9XJ21_APOLU|nr:hypothetical protein GE061_014736 [Apolygus lucorum]
MKPVVVLMMLVGVSVGQHLWSPHLTQNSASSSSTPSRADQLERQPDRGFLNSWPSRNQQLSSPRQLVPNQELDPRWTGPVVFPAGHEGVNHYRPAPQVTENVQELDNRRSGDLIPSIHSGWAINPLPQPRSWPYVSQRVVHTLQPNADDRSHLTAYFQEAPRGHFYR